MGELFEAPRLGGLVVGNGGMFGSSLSGKSLKRGSLGGRLTEGSSGCSANVESIKCLTNMLFSARSWSFPSNSDSLKWFSKYLK